MYKYDFYLRDYRAKTGHLDFIHHAAYRQLIDVYYDSERPLPGKPELCRRLAGAFSEDERAAVDDVLKEFFSKGADGLFRNEKADEEIAKYRQFVELQREKGKKGGRPHKADGIPDGLAAGNPTVKPEGNPEESLSSTPTPSSTSTPTSPRKKKPVSEVKPSDTAFGLAEFLLSELQSRYPSIKTPNIAAWAKDCDRMIRIDKRSPRDAEDMIRWMAGDFWGTVVLCPAKLREKWDQIAAKMAATQTANGGCSEAQKHKYDFLEETA